MQDTIALVSDLIFSSKIIATARAAGVSLQVVRDPLALSQKTGSLLILDLNLPGAIDAAAEWKSRTSGHAIGFVAHTDSETIKKARESGIDQVLPPSAFTEHLPELLRRPQ